MSRSHLLSIFLIMFLSLVAKGQPKMDFAQSLSNPNNLFPELTGWHGGVQSTMGYRNQGTGIPSSWLGYAYNVDAYVPAIRSGIGISANHMRTDLLLTNSNTLDVSISPKINLGEETTLMPAIALQYGQYSRDFRGLYSNPGMDPVLSSTNYISFGAGIGIIKKDGFVAIHSDYLTRPDVSFYANSKNRIPIGYQFIAGHNFKSGSFTLTPSAIYQRIDGFSAFGLAMNVQYKPIYIGVRLGHSVRTFALAAGYEIKERVRLSYCYEVASSSISQPTAHELALRIWLFKNKAKRQFLSNLPLI